MFQSTRHDPDPSYGRRLLAATMVLWTVLCTGAATVPVYWAYKFLKLFLIVGLRFLFLLLFPQQALPTFLEIEPLRFVEVVEVDLEMPEMVEFSEAEDLAMDELPPPPEPQVVDELVEPEPVYVVGYGGLGTRKDPPPELEEDLVVEFGGLGLVGTGPIDPVEPEPIAVAELSEGGGSDSGLVAVLGTSGEVGILGVRATDADWGQLQGLDVVLAVEGRPAELVAGLDVGEPVEGGVVGGIVGHGGGGSCCGGIDAYRVWRERCSGRGLVDVTVEHGTDGRLHVVELQAETRRGERCTRRVLEGLHDGDADGSVVHWSL